MDLWRRRKSCCRRRRVVLDACDWKGIVMGLLYLMRRMRESLYFALCILEIVGSRSIFIGLIVYGLKVDVLRTVLRVLWDVGYKGMIERSDSGMEYGVCFVEYGRIRLWELIEKFGKDYGGEERKG
ncbi:hypothetical protein Tco_0989473 [Tanacetum coccineum]|uniref:Uncharacterized protein n=1 Tax=Tanacetum coccineum TaxID=301880 RepID=A0ABQ5EU75_9ASTR